MAALVSAIVCTFQVSCADTQVEQRTLQISVVDATGAPVEYYRWTLTVEEASSLKIIGEPELHRLGGSVTVNHPDGILRELLVEARGFAPQLVDPSQGIVRVTLERCDLAISGRVLASSGAPVPNAHVDLVLPRTDPVDDLLRRPQTLRLYAARGNCVSSDAYGNFRILNEFPALPCRVRAWREGFAPRYSEEVTGAVQQLELELSPAGLLIGQVQLGDALSATGSRLVARQDNTEDGDCKVGREFVTLIDAHGGYRFMGLESGNWMITLELAKEVQQALGWSARDGVTCSQTPYVLKVGSTETTVENLDFSTPHGPCNLNGRLVVGEQIEGYAYLQHEGTRIAFVDVSSEGSFRLSARRPGEYRLVVRAGPAHGQYRLVTDLVILGLGETDWVRSLTPAEWLTGGVRLDSERR